MDFGTRTARACITHFPEVIMLISIEDMVFRQELFPVRSGLVVTLQTFFGTAFEHGCIEVFRIQLQHVYQILPCPGDGFFLEVIAKRPVTQHLEHGMVISVMTHFFQVIVFSADTKTFLRVRHSFIFRRVITQNNIFKLVHTRVGKHQRGVIFNHHGSRRHNLVTFTFEKTLERVSDFICSQHTSYF